MRKLRSAIVGIILILQISPASAAPVTANGGEAICNQTVGDATGVSAYRLSAGYCVIEFRNVGSTTWTVPTGVTSISYLVVAGGGGGAGGQASEHGGGGGGAGGVLSGTLSTSPGSINIAVGAGGTAGLGNGSGVKGGNSTLAGTIIAIGGGGGGNYYSSGPTSGGSGGGAGSSDSSSYRIGADGTAGQGSKGGNVTAAGTNGRHGGGGGGAGGVGGNTTFSSPLTIAAGAGGVGTTSSITGSTLYYGGGGGGGGSSQGAGASGGANGGTGGGGSGATYNGSVLVASATAGTNNTGGGGGGGIGTGASAASTGGRGGSGIVILSYLLPPAVTIAPSITGITTLNQGLSSTNGTWSNSPTSFTYQWSRSATAGGTYTNIPGAVNSNYTVVSADVGQYLKLSVTATNSNGSSTSTSDATAQVRKLTPTFAAWSNVNKTFGDSAYTVAPPTVSGSLPGTLSYGSSDTSVITISGSTFTVAGGGSATITATFTPTDSANYETATTANLVTVGKAAQAPITVTSTSASMGVNLNLTSTGGSTGGNFLYTKISGDCTIAGAVLTPTSAGSCVVQATLPTNASYFAETATATITISRSTASAEISIQAGTLIFREIKVITAVSTVAGKVTFKVNGKRLAGCTNKVVNGLNSFTATCSYRPSTRGLITITTTLDPTDNSYIGLTTSSAKIFVGNRSSGR